MCTLIFMSPMMAQDGTWALTTFMFVRVAMTPQHCQMGYVFVYSVVGKVAYKVLLLSCSF